MGQIYRLGFIPTDIRNAPWVTLPKESERRNKSIPACFQEPYTTSKKGALIDKYVRHIEELENAVCLRNLINQKHIMLDFDKGIVTWFYPAFEAAWSLNDFCLRHFFDHRKIYGQGMYLASDLLLYGYLKVRRFEDSYRNEPEGRVNGTVGSLKQNISGIEDVMASIKKIIRKNIAEANKAKSFLDAHYDCSNGERYNKANSTNERLKEELEDILNC